jgi:hypothetical protein
MSCSYRISLALVLLGLLSATPARAQYVRPGDYFRGVGDLVTAYGRYLNDYQSARLLNQQVEQEKIRTRQMLRDQERYEPSLLPSAEEIQERRRQLELRRALEAPATEVVSGDALNTLLKAIQSMKAQDIPGPVVPLDEDTLRHLHVSGAGGGNPAALQTQKIGWPLAMRDTPYDEDRQKFQELADAARQQLAGDALQLSTVRALEATVDHLEATLNARAREESVQDIIDVQRQIERLRDGVRALRSPGAANYFNAKWAARGRDINELVDNMTRENLRFAAADDGDEGAYQALHRAMASYVHGANLFQP